MALFNFFKRNYKKATHNPAIEPTEQHGFTLKFTDFEIQIHKAKVIKDAWLSDDPEFRKEIAGLIIGEPAKQGDVIKLNTAAATIILWEQTIEVTFNPGKIFKDAEEFVDVINKQLNWTRQNKDLFYTALKQQLLQLKNTNWLRENEPAVTGEEFLKSVRLTSIQFHYNAGFELHFDDGNTFGGHTILVTVSSTREIEAASAG